MKKILVGTDFGDSSRKALKFAKDLAQRYQATIHLLHVLEPVDEPDSQDPETAAFYAKLEKASEEKFRLALEEVQDTKVASQVRVGPRHPTILAVAQENQADLIVLGSHALKPDEQRIGTSHRVAITSPVPVLLVP